MNKPVTDVTRRVWVENESACLHIQPYPDAPDTALEIATLTNDSITYFGKVSIVMSKDYARALGEALIAASQD